MAKFKVVMTFPDGEVIDSYEEDGDGHFWYGTGSRRLFLWMDE